MIPDVVIIGTKFWDKLSDQEKEWLMSASKESVIKQKQFWKETIVEQMEMLKKNDVQFFYPDKVPFQVKSKPVMENLMKILFHEPSHYQDISWFLAL